MQARILGLTGPNAAGKGEVARLLVEWGFGPVYSLSDIVREEAARQGLEPTREHLIRVGTELRHIGGAGVLAEKLLPRLADRPRAIVDSIRHPEEVRWLRHLAGFVLIAVTAPVEERFARSRQRGRSGDPASLEEFIAREKQENGPDPVAQQLDATIAEADWVLDNGAGLEQLAAELRTQLSIGASQPSS